MGPESAAMLAYLLGIFDAQIDAVSHIFQCERCQECRWTSCQMAGALRLQAKLQRKIARQRDQDHAPLPESPREPEMAERRAWPGTLFGRLIASPWAGSGQPRGHSGRKRQRANRWRIGTRGPLRSSNSPSRQGTLREKSRRAGPGVLSLKDTRQRANRWRPIIARCGPQKSLRP
jgi:hypothetical protein